jgi:error-prone DNA polymerase
MPMGEQVVADYETTSLTVKAHPVGLLRDRLAGEGWRDCGRLADCPDGAPMRVAGLVLVRQRPGSARGVIFITIEDETGTANLVVLPPVFERLRRPVLQARLLGAVGRVERRAEVIHLRVDDLADLSPRLAHLTPARGAANGPALARHLARADEVRRPTVDQRDRAAALQKPRSFR